MACVTLEFFGIPRQQAGRAELVVHAITAADALRTAAAHCPGLAVFLDDQGRLTRHCLLSLDGTRFLADGEEPLPEGSRLLVMSADAGG